MHDDFWSPSSKQTLDFWDPEFTGVITLPRPPKAEEAFVEGTIDLDPLVTKTVYKREKYFVSIVADIGGIAGVAFAIVAIFGKAYNRGSKNIDEVQDFFKFDARNAYHSPQGLAKTETMETLEAKGRFHEKMKELEKPSLGKRAFCM